MSEFAIISEIARNVLEATVVIVTLIVQMVVGYRLRQAHKDIAATKEAVVTVEKATNSMKDEQVRMASVIAHAAGLREGQELKVTDAKTAKAAADVLQTAADRAAQTLQDAATLAARTLAEQAVDVKKP